MKSFAAIVFTIFIILASHIVVHADEGTDASQSSPVKYADRQLQVPIETIEEYMDEVQQEQDFFENQKENEALELVEVQRPYQTTQY